jgi:hypothetical protein
MREILFRPHGAMCAGRRGFGGNGLKENIGKKAMVYIRDIFQKFLITHKHSLPCSSNIQKIESAEVLTGEGSML